MRSFATIVVCAAVFLVTGCNQTEKFVSDIDNRALDAIMMLSPVKPGNWDPKTFLDLAYPWPESYIERFQQPFNSYTFSRNAAALVALSKEEKNVIKVARMAEYLDFIANIYTVDEKGCAYITNEFEYGYLWSKFNYGFRGAFMNNVTAYGYLHLFEATGDRAYRKKAYRLLKASAFCETKDVKLHSVDENGYFWLNEYVFEMPKEDEALFSHLGFQKGDDGWWRARVYNGHIHALLAFIKYKVMTGSDEFDEVINKSIETMRYYLPLQIFDGKYFSYMVEMPSHPDYGQRRAEHLARGLCEISSDKSICQTATELTYFYENNIKDRDAEIHKQGTNDSRNYIRQWRLDNQLK